MDVTEKSFETEVIERVGGRAGRRRLLGRVVRAVQGSSTPVLEEAVEGRGVTLAKVDVDANQALAQRVRHLAASRR